MNNKSETLVNVILGALLVVGSILFWEQVKGFYVFFVTLGILVFVHEWGHFIAARSVGVRAYEFALGFGPKLITYWRKEGTEYTIRALPLGGFVHLKGMQPDDPITSDGLNGRRPAERALVYMAGPLMNIILAVAVLLFRGALIGVEDPKITLVGPVTPKSPAKKVQVVSKNGQPVTGMPTGLQAGDRILKINDKVVEKPGTVYSTIHGSAGKEVTLTVLRGKDELVLKGTPPPTKIEEEFLTITSVPNPNGSGLMVGDQLDSIDGNLVDLEMAREALAKKAGQPVELVVWRNGRERMEVKTNAAPWDLSMRPGERTVGQFGFMLFPGQSGPVSLTESLKNGAADTRTTFIGMGALFSRGGKRLTQNVGGPIAIFNLLGEVQRLPLLFYFNTLASISLSLALFNLFPIPLLDGGHLFVLAVEVIRRRRLEADTQRLVALVGLAIIGVLFVTITLKDVFKHF